MAKSPDAIGVFPFFLAGYPKGTPPTGPSRALLPPALPTKEDPEEGDPPRDPRTHRPRRDPSPLAPWPRAVATRMPALMRAPRGAPEIKKRTAIHGPPPPPGGFSIPQGGFFPAPHPYPPPGDRRLKAPFSWPLGPFFPPGGGFFSGGGIFLGLRPHPHPPLRPFFPGPWTPQTPPPRQRAPKTPLRAPGGRGEVCFPIRNEKTPLRGVKTAHRSIPSYVGGGGRGNFLPPPPLSPCRGGRRGRCPRAGWGRPCGAPDR